MSELPSGTVTFLMTDVEGSTRLWEERPIEMAAAIEVHEVLARDVIEKHGGHLLLERGEGDSLFAVFASPSAAVSAALDLQMRLVEPVADIILRVRIGLHAGEAQARGSTYFGRTVNRAARIRSAAAGGQILVSQAVREIAEPGLPAGLSLRDCGKHRLRDLLRAEQLYEVVHPSLPRVSTPLRSLEMHPHNLPLQLTSFVGRQQPLRDAVAMVREHRLVTLLGAGGCGKTRLSIQVGAEVLEDFEDGVWLVEAAPIREEAALLDEINRVLQIDPSGSLKRDALLILDNCEHLREAAARAARSLIERVEGLHILATSREALGLRGERVCPLRSMMIPPKGTPAEELEDFEASALFMERAHEKDPNLELSLDDAAAICEIVRVLDGIPLAIEQAASHVGFLSSRQLLERLDEWMSQPAEYFDENDDPRHRTLEAAIDWSFHLLSAGEQSLFLRLAVFAGSWDLEAVVAVCSEDDLPGSDVLRVMQRLANKSLVILEMESRHGRRFRLLQPIKQYAVRRLSLGATSLYRRHFEHFLERSNSVANRVSGADQVEALADAAADIDNFRQAIDFALDSEPTTALSLAMNLRRYWLLTGSISEGRRLIGQCLTAGEQPPRIEAMARNALGGFAWQQGQYAEAADFFQGSLNLLGRDEEPQLRAQIFHNLGLLWTNEMEFDRAENALRSSIDIFDKLGHEPDKAQGMLSLVHLLLETGRSEAARQIIEGALEILDRRHDKVRLPRALVQASEAWSDADEQTAVMYLRRSLELCKHEESSMAGSACLFQIGMYLIGCGQTQSGAVLLGGSERLCAESEVWFDPRHVRMLDDLPARLAPEFRADFERNRRRGARSTKSALYARATQALQLLDTNPKKH